MNTKWLLLVFAVALATGCRRKAECGWGTAVGPWALKANWTCNDGKLRSVECQRTQSAFKCSCIVGDGAAAQGSLGARPVASFVLPSLSSLETREAATSTANELCNWSLAP
jgi:hypothetical protein